MQKVYKMRIPALFKYPDTIYIRRDEKLIREIMAEIKKEIKSISLMMNGKYLYLMKQKSC